MSKYGGYGCDVTREVKRIPRFHDEFEDPVLDSLRSQALKGWPDSQRECPYEIRNYWTFKE